MKKIIFKKILQFNKYHNFCSNPYYLLDCKPTDSFPEIKAKYLSLAQQYHPDHNKDPNATQSFLKIKKAYEDIQIQKGLKKPDNQTYVHQDVESVRPNKHFYEENQSDSNSKGLDFKEFSFRAKDQYEGFSSSFRTMANLKDIKFRPDEGEIKNSYDRFKIGEKQRLKVFSDGGSLYGLVILAWLMIVMWAGSRAEVTVEEKTQENQLYQLENQKEYLNIQNKEEFGPEGYGMDQKKLKEFKNRLQDQQLMQQYKLDMLMPKKESFYIQQ